MSDALIVVGAGGFGREAIDVADSMRGPDGSPAWNVLGVVDDHPSEENRERLSRRGLPYLGTTTEASSSWPNAHYVIGIGAPRVRRELADRLAHLEGWTPAVLVHAAATLGSDVVIGPGSVICAGARLTTNIALGRHVHINPNATVGHDTSLGDFVSLNPAASISGDCILEDGVLVGVQGVVLNQLTVGAEALVGAAACVTTDVPPSTTVVGVPARPLERGARP